MKLGAALAIMLIIAILVLTGIFTINASMLRVTEVQTSITTSLIAMESYLGSTTYTDSEYQQLLVRNIINSTSSKSKFTINFYGCDVQKGVVSVEVIEEYQAFNTTRKKSYRRTMILEQYTDAEGNKQQYTRYIDSMYYSKDESEGGCKTTSIWKNDYEYSYTLIDALANTIKATYTYTADEAAALRNTAFT